MVTFSAKFQNFSIARGAELLMGSEKSAIHVHSRVSNMFGGNRTTHVVVRRQSLMFFTFCFSLPLFLSLFVSFFVSFLFVTLSPVYGFIKVGLVQQEMAVQIWTRFRLQRFSGELRNPFQSMEQIWKQSLGCATIVARMLEKKNSKNEKMGAKFVITILAIYKKEVPPK